MSRFLHFPLNKWCDSQKGSTYSKGLKKPIEVCAMNFDPRVKNNPFFAHCSTTCQLPCVKGIVANTGTFSDLLPPAPPPLQVFLLTSKVTSSPSKWSVTCYGCCIIVLQLRLLVFVSLWWQLHIRRFLHQGKIHGEFFALH